MKQNLPELELIIAHSHGEGLEPAVPFSVMTNLTPRDGCYCGSRHRHGKLAFESTVTVHVIYFRGCLYKCLKKKK